MLSLLFDLFKAYVGLVELSARMLLLTMRMFCIRPFVRHPYGWAVSEELTIGMYTCLTGCHDKNLLKIGLGLQTMFEAAVTRTPHGVRLTRVPGSTPGSERGWWIDLHDQHHAGGLSKQGQADKIIIFYIHGGGFAVGHPLMHNLALRHLLKQLRQHGVEARIFSVRYPLSSEACHPAALQCVLKTYGWLFEQINPGTPVIVGADSAGANLALVMLISLRNAANAGTAEAPDATAAGSNAVATTVKQLPLLGQAQADSSSSPTNNGLTSKSAITKGAADSTAALPQPLAAILISPWADLSSSSVIMDPRYRNKLLNSPDFISLNTLEIFSRSYVGGADGSLDSTALAARLADPQVLVVAGSLEVLVPDIRALVRRLAADGLDVVYHEEPNMVHSYLLGPAPRLYGRQAPVVEFVADVLQGRH